MKDEVFEHESEAKPKSQGPRVLLEIALVVCFLAWAGYAYLQYGYTDRDRGYGRVKCANNLRQIGLAITLYAGDFHGEYPDSLGTLLLTEDITAAVFDCPQTADDPPDEPTTKSIVDHLMDGGHMSYVYLGSGLKNGSVPADAVIAYEPLSNHDGAGMNVLFGDDHVEFLDANVGAKIITAAAATTRPVIVPGLP